MKNKYELISNIIDILDNHIDEKTNPYYSDYIELMKNYLCEEQEKALKYELKLDDETYDSMFNTIYYCLSDMTDSISYRAIDCDEDDDKVRFQWYVKLDRSEPCGTKVSLYNDENDTLIKGWCIIDEDDTCYVNTHKIMRMILMWKR